MLIRDILSSSNVSFSFEVFPPKKQESFERMQGVVKELSTLRPSFTSVTFGAGGGRDAYTADIAEMVEKCGTPALAHQTCVATSRDQIKANLDSLRARGVQNVLALRGDLPAGMSPDDLPADCFAHASDLVAAIRAYAPDFCIGAACYPECHPENPHLTEDLRHLKEKVDAGVDFLTTQMFFDNALFYRFLWRAREAGIHVPIVAGIMPITNGKQVERARMLSGSYMPHRFMSIVDKFGDNPAAMQQAGIAYATDQIVDLLANGVTAIHLYTMNKPQVAAAIMSNLSELLGPRA